MKTILSVSLLCLSFNVFSQSGGLGGAPTSPIDSTTNPSGVGFGAGTPGTTSPGTTSPGLNTPAPGATSPDFTSQPRGNEFPQQQQDTTPDLPSTNFPSTSPAFPSTTPTVPNTVPGATNPAGTGVVPGPVGSGTVGP